MKKKPAFFIAPILLLLVFWAGTALAEEFSGDYEIRADGQVLGVERWKITLAKDGTVSTESSGSLKPGGEKDPTKIDDLTEMRVRADHTLENYQREVTMDKLPRRLVTEFDGTNFSVHLNAGKNVSDRKLKVPADSLVVDVGVYHHLGALLLDAINRKRLGKPIPVIIPSEYGHATAYVDSRGADAVALTGGSFAAVRYFIDMGLYGVSAWTDDRGRLLKLVIPTTGVTVQIARYQGTSAAPSAPKKAANAVGRSETTFSSISLVEGVKEILLHAMLRQPKTEAGKRPGVIFLSDTGPQDASGVDAATGLNTLTGDLCDAVAESGYAVLTWDDRGAGKSMGQAASATLDVLLADAEAALDLMKKREDVDPSRIAVMGLGEGANVALRLAAKRPEIKAVIAIAPSPVPFTRLAEEQIRRRLEAEGAFVKEDMDQNPVMIAIKQSRQNAKDFIILGGKPVFLNLYRQWDKLDPPADLKKIKAPVLHLTMGKDQQVFGDLNAPLLAAGKEKSDYLHKDFPLLDHFLVRGRGTLGGYSDPDRAIDAEASGYIARWLNQRLSH